MRDSPPAAAPPDWTCSEMCSDRLASQPRCHDNGRKVTIIARHNEVPEITARGALREAQNWKEP